MIAVDSTACEAGVQAAAGESWRRRLRRLGGRFETPIFYLLLLAVAGFALGYAVQVLPS